MDTKNSGRFFSIVGLMGLVSVSFIIIVCGVLLPRFGVQLIELSEGDWIAILLVLFAIIYLQGLLTNHFNRIAALEKQAHQHLQPPDQASAN